MRLNTIKTAMLFSAVMAILSTSYAVDDTVKKSLRKSLTIDGGMMNNLPSPRATEQFYRNAETLGLYAYDVMEKYVYRTTDTQNTGWVKFRRFVQVAGLPFLAREFIVNPQNYITSAGDITTHEYSHRTRGALDGYAKSFNPEYIENGRNPFGLFATFLTNGLEAGGSVWKGGASVRTYKRPSFIRRYDGDSCVANYEETSCINDSNVLDIVAGVNNQVNLARNLTSRDSIIGSVDVANAYVHFTNVMSYYMYAEAEGDPEGDRAKVIENWKASGKTFDDAKLGTEQLLATLASGTTWAYGLGVYDYINTGNRNAQQIRVGGLRLPDFYVYYNLNGPSIKASTDYKITDNSFLVLEYEKIYRSARNREVTLGYKHIFNPDITALNSIMIAGESAYNLESKKTTNQARIDMFISKNASVNFTYTQYHYDTLAGRRDIPTLENGKRDTQAYGGLNITF